MTTFDILKAAKKAAPMLAVADTETKNNALLAMADALEAHCDAVLAANAEDMEVAKEKLSQSMLDRLKLTKDRIAGMADGIRQVVALPDPVGKVYSTHSRPNGITIEKVGVPMGVVAIIYESRPNVTSDAAALALKSGSACVLRCGKEAWRSSFAIVKALRSGLAEAGLPEAAVSLIEDTTRQSANEKNTDVTGTCGGQLLNVNITNCNTAFLLESVTGMGFGSIKYYTYSMDDAEFAAYVSSQGGVLNYK